MRLGVKVRIPCLTYALPDYYLAIYLNMDFQTYPSSFALAVLDAAVSKGVNRNDIIDKVGIPADVLASEQGRISAKNLQEITQYVAIALDDESLGFLQAPIRVGSFRMMSLACLGAPNLREVTKRCRDFYSLFSDSLPVNIYEKEGKAYWMINSKFTPSDPKNYMIPAFFGSLYRWSSWMINQKIVLDSVAFSSAKTDILSDFHILFSCPIKFSASENYLCFDANYLDKEIVQNEDTLKTFLSGGNMGLLAHPKSNDSYYFKVQRILKTGGSQLNIEDIAEQLHSSPETLRRKLKHEGTTVKLIKDGLRRDEAIYLLSRGNTSIDEVAAQVGFSDSTAFFRAFKRWTGVTPRSYIKGGG